MQFRYDSNEFETITYKATSGGLGCPDSDARMVYYGSNPLPHLLFNGTTLLVGAGTDAINGSAYDPIVQSMLDDSTPLRMEIHDLDIAAGWAEINLVLDQDMPDDISHTVIRVALVEDDLLYNATIYNNIVRDMLPDIALTIDQAFEAQYETVNFALEGGWNPANMRIVAFVQNDDTKHIYQSCNSQPVPPYSMRYFSQGDLTVFVDGDHTYEEAFLFNQGSEISDYRITLDTDDLSAGWNAYFTIVNDDYTSFDVTLVPGERIGMAVTIEAGETGQGSVELIFESLSGQVSPRRIAYSVITSDTSILLVDDDGAYDYETEYFAPALDPLGASYAIWNRNTAALSGPLLANFDAVIWQCGWAFPTVDADDRAALAEYLDGGGRLFITGQDIGWEMNDIGGEARTWYRNYLHANYINDDTNDFTLEGFPGDPIGDGISLVIAGGDGANNQDYPSDIDPLGVDASGVFYYDGQRNGAVKADTGVYRVVYLAFGYEAINNAADRALVMERIMNWLMPVVSAPDGVPRALELVGNVPNPFNPKTEIVFRLGSATDVELTVYDIAGHRIVGLVDGARPAGENRVAWDGRDTRGRAMPAGTYFYRLEGAGLTESGKMVLVR
jgi:hypothetical protein